MKIQFKNGDVKKYHEIKGIFDYLPFGSQHVIWSSTSWGGPDVVFTKDVTVTITVKVDE